MQVIWMLIFRSDVISALIYLSLVVKTALIYLSLVVKQFAINP
ncbi:hypothetical protein LTSEMON_4466 [Salmonella enterica subsp. enterica serovar Montevideo str. S5-403]|uniref:Uncharacterized protein n=1 Tax=Salmonella enterica subsp. enterica serovar Montevideo str. S5-403 TaxID=913242 RepID=G5Q7Z9_SALMO|nr:hypothetical protein LTSEMON_4466 [Salmonella enterica subsp. enterica serovar Montevideo str. S5-403]